MADTTSFGKTGSPRDLRARAEELLRTEEAERPTLPTREVQELVHELRVHQTELEIQNEELRHAQVELAEARDRYADLYKFAPVGYVTLDREGKILEANLMAATMLGIERQALLSLNLANFVDFASQDHWYLYRQAVFAGEGTLNCELKLKRREDGELLAVRAVRLESIAFEADSDRRCRTALIDISERKEAEDALLSLNLHLGESLADRGTRLRESINQVKLFNGAVAHLGEGIIITADNLQWPGPEILFVNEAMCRISGYAAEELIGQTPRLLQGRDTDRAALNRIKTELDAGRSCLAEIINYRKDGTAYDAELFITPLFDEAGRRTNFVSIHRDTTERKKSAAALRESEERNRAILDGATDAIITIDPQGIIVGANPATTRVFAYARDELLGSNVSLLMPSPYREEHDASLARSHETVEARIIGAGREVEGRRKDGSTFPVDLSVNKVDDLGLFTGIIRDISKRKQAEEELRIEHEFSEKIIETVQTIILVLDPEGRIVRVNPYFEELTGWDREEVVGRDWFSTFVPERERERLSGVFANAVEGKRTRGTVSGVLTKEGKERLVQWFDAALTNEGGSFVGLLCAGTDVTERRRLEDEVIIASEEERERISRDLHDDLGSLLTGIKLGAEALATELVRGGDGALERSRVIPQQIGEAIGKTREIAHGLRPVGSDPEDLMSALQRLCARTADASPLQCRLDCPEPLLVYERISANHLYRIAQEAVNNALKHSGASEITISLQTLDDSIQLRVEDDGAGCNPAAPGGTGLGLPTMRYRAHAMKGSLRIERSKAGGTSVVCTIPRASAGEA